MTVIAPSPWCPALLRRVRDLDALRHDFPLLLFPPGHPAGPLRPLPAALDAAVPADAPRGDRLALEAALRRCAAPGAAVPLAELLERHAPRLLGAEQDAARRTRRLAQLARLGRDWEGAALVGCGVDAPERVVAHLHRTHVATRGAAIRAEIDALSRALARVLDADAAASPAAWDADGLRAATSPRHAAELDFDALAALLTTGRPARTLPPARRERIAAALAALRAQRFFGVDDAGAAPLARRVTEALRVGRDRLPAAAAFLEAVRVARRELARHRGARLDDAAPAPAPTRDELALFPAPLVVLDTDTLPRDDALLLLDALAAGVPLKAVVRTGTALAAPGGDAADAWRAALGAMAAGLGTAYVVQGTAAQLARLADAIAAALAHDGPALVFVYAAGANSTAHLPPYLLAAAAAESRAFVPFVFDPAAGVAVVPDGAVAEPDADWPSGALAYEDDRLQAVVEPLRFTTADFLAADPHLAPHFRAVPRARWTADLVPVDAWLRLDRAERRRRQPYVVVVDGDERLQRLVPDDAILAATRHAAARWRRLRPPPPAPREAAAPQPQAALATPPPAPAAGAAWIETGRCTSCHECLNVSSRMFAYDDNGQAYLRDAAAGTYRELVEAAERCQLALIHPGEPRDLAEPGLDELRRRAAAFG